MILAKTMCAVTKCTKKYVHNGEKEKQTPKPIIKFHYHSATLEIREHEVKKS